MPIRSYSEAVKDTRDFFRTGGFAAQQEAMQEKSLSVSDVEPTSFVAGAQAMFAEENWLTSVVLSETLPFVFDRYDPNYYPYDDMKEYEGQPDAEMLLEAKNPQHMSALKERLKRSRVNNDLISRMPTGQRIMAGLAAGVLSPEIILPGTAIVKGAKGTNIAMSALVSAGAGAGAVSISEAGLRLTQPDRSGAESAVTIGFGAILGGLLGGGAALLSKAQFDDLAKNIGRDITGDVDNADVIGAPAPASVGAAEAPKFTSDELEISGRAAQLYSQIKSKVPIIRTPFEVVMNSPFVSAKNAFVRLMEVPVPLKAAASKVMPQAAETERLLWKQKSAKWLKDTRSLFHEYKKVEKVSGNKPMTLGAFYEAVDYATRNNDVFPGNEFVEQAARLQRRLYNDGLSEGKALGIFTEETEAKFAESYGHRIWKKKALVQKRDEALEVFERWARKKTNLIIEDLDARIAALAAKGPRISSKQADQLAELKMERRIIGDDIGGGVDEYAKDMAERVYGMLVDGDHQGGGFFNRVPQDFRGPLREKLLDMEDNEVLPFIERRADVVATRYAEKMGAEIGIARALGDSPSMKNTLDELQQEYLKMSKGLSGKEAQKLNNQYRRVRSNLQDLRDLLRGNYRHNLDGESLAAQAHTAIRDWVYTTTLGGVTLSSLPDAARTIMVHGIARSFGDIVSGLDEGVSKAAKQMAKAEREALGFDLEDVMGSVLVTRSDITDPMARGSAITRVSGMMTDTFTKATLIDKWNNIMKNFAMRVTQSRVLNAIDSGAEDKYLNFLGIDAATRKIVKEQAAKHGRKVGYRRFSGADKWDTSDPAVANALRVYSSALRKEANTIVVTRSLGDIPMWANTPAGKLIFQLKSYVWAADHRVTMRGLSDANASAVFGATMMAGLGMAISELKGKSYELGREIAGQEPVDREKNLQSKILDGIDRSGVLPLILYVNNLWGMTGAPNIETAIGAQTPSRYAQQRQRTSLMGPAFSNAVDGSVGLASLVKAIHDPDAKITDTDLKNVQKIIPFNNVEGLRFGFDALRGQAREALDVK